jgi:hypothetical protein
MFTNETDFISTGLGALLAGIEKLHVLFATYKNVDGYANGPVETYGKDGLTIQVQNGSQIRGEWVSRAAYSIEAIPETEGQENVLFLAVVYAGVNAFGEAVAFARKIKHEHPASKIVLVTCSCDLLYKNRILEPIVRDKEIEVVVTEKCGGNSTMRDILRKIMEDWPVKIPA